MKFLDFVKIYGHEVTEGFELILHDTFTTEGFRTEHDKARFLAKIVALSGEDIEKQDLIINLIDTQFEDLKWVIKFQAFVYNLGFTIPFVLQIMTSN